MFADFITSDFDSCGMHIRLFIVTYKGESRLQTCLSSLFSSDLQSCELEVYIINNHTKFNIDAEFEDKVKVLHNSLRPDWSNGHLSRNWNQALLHGFEDLSDPVCDAVVAVQDDTRFHDDWYTKLEELHDTYSIVQNGLGDQFISYQPQGVKNIGLWDERFIFSGHALDYFNRAYLFNTEDTSINDFGHDRSHNLIFPDDPEKSANYLVDADPREIDDQWDQSKLSVRIGSDLLQKKYGDDYYFSEFKQDPTFNRDNAVHMFYPYFEKAVENKEEIGYVYDKTWDQEANSKIGKVAESEKLLWLVEKLGMKKVAKKVYKQIAYK
jgi:hypothetical protein